MVLWALLGYFDGALVMLWWDQLLYERDGERCLLDDVFKVPQQLSTCPIFSSPIVFNNGCCNFVEEIKPYKSVFFIHYLLKAICTEASYEKVWLLSCGQNCTAGGGRCHLDLRIISTPFCRPILRTRPNWADWSRLLLNFVPRLFWCSRISDLLLVTKYFWSEEILWQHFLIFACSFSLNI